MIHRSRPHAFTFAPVLALLVLGLVALGMPRVPAGAARLAATPVGGIFYVTERSDQGVARVSVDAHGNATVQNDFVTGLPASGPDSLVFDHHGNLLIANTDAGTISVADPATGRVTIPVLNVGDANNVSGIADMALDPTLDVVWAINYGGSTLARVDLATGAVTTTDLSQDPQHSISGLGGIAFNADGTRLFVSTHANSIAEVDPQTRAVVRVLPVGGEPDGMTFDPATGHLFAAGCSGICELAIGSDAAPSLSLVKIHTAIDGDGIAADGKGHIIVVSSGDTLSVLDLASDTAATEATGIKSADDVAPVAGAGAPVLPTDTPTVPPINTPVPPAATTSAPRAVTSTPTRPVATTTSARPATSTPPGRPTVPAPTETSVPPPAQSPSITLDHTSAEVGVTVRVTGQGFGPHETITLSFNGEALATGPVVVTTDANGRFTATFVTPGSLVGGPNTVSATGASSRRTAVAPLTGIRYPPAQFYFAGALDNAAERSALALVNPTGGTARVTLTFYFDHGATTTATLSIEPARQRLVPLAPLTPYRGVFGLSVSATRVVAAQLIFTRDGRDGDTTLGNGALGRHWYLAEGYTGLTFHETVSILNPSVTTLAHVRLQLLPFGRFRGRTVSVTAPAHTNRVVDINALLPRRSLSIIADADHPVVVERTLTFSDDRRGHGYGLTTQRGANVAATNWLFAEGTTVNRFETYLTILNPNGARARVMARFYGAGIRAGRGAQLASRSIVIAPRSRANIKLNDVLSASGVASVVTSDRPIVVERPEYFGSPNGVRIAGSDVFGRNGAGASWSFPGGDTRGLSEFLLLYNPSAVRVPVDVTVYGASGRPRFKRIVVAPNVRYTLDMAHAVGGITAQHGTLVRGDPTDGVGFVAEQTVFAPDHTTLRSTQGLAQ